MLNPLNSFDATFTIMSIMFFAILIVALAFMFSMIYKVVKTKRANDKAAILQRNATVVTKRMSVYNFTTYYVTFELDNKERIELSVSGEEYGLLVENDYGLLTSQGTRFISFERK